MRDREPKSHRHWLLAAAGALLVFAAAFWVAAGGPRAKATTTLPKRFTCPPNSSAQKCASLTAGPFSGKSGTTPPPVFPGPTTPPESPSLIKPGAGFLSPSTQSALVANYGMLTIFRYYDWWVVLGSGQNQTSLATPPPITPRGPLVAVEKCHGTNRLACLNPDTPHSVANFVVVPPPLSSMPIGLFATGARHFLYFSNNLTLDLDNLSWYHASITALAKDPGAFSPLATASPRHGIPLS